MHHPPPIQNTQTKATQCTTHHRYRILKQKPPTATPNPRSTKQTHHDSNPQMKQTHRRRLKPTDETDPLPPIQTHHHRNKPTDETDPQTRDPPLKQTHKRDPPPIQTHHNRNRPTNKTHHRKATHQYPTPPSKCHHR